MTRRHSVPPHGQRGGRYEVEVGQWFAAVAVTIMGSVCWGVRLARQSTRAWDVNFAEFPWMVSVQVSEVGSWVHTCGGTLVDPSWVLAAADCVEGMSEGDVRVVVGEDSVNGHHLLPDGVRLLRDHHLWMWLFRRHRPTI